MPKKQFQAESKRLLDLMINSIYTKKEIFLRELISNASDAIDKLAYKALTDDKVGKTRDDFQITISVDEPGRTLTISDNGIGMTKSELSEHLGVIAKSGSGAFKENLEDGADAQIIGQFGVGFYSAFMIASEVQVISRAYGEESAHKWRSEGADGYTITQAQKEEVGTDVIIQLRDDTAEDKVSEFLQSSVLRQIIKKYSDYIRYPIVLDDETLNSMVPIWQKAKGDTTEDELFSFYKEHWFDFHDPLSVQHVSAEGTAVSYRAMLFYPSKAPHHYYSKDFEAGLSLYTQGVMILEHCPEFLPEHFRFVRGIVDSADLSLNISREMLQQDRQIKTIAASLEKKIKSELKRMMDNQPEKYNTLFEQFGLQLKYGIVQNYGAKKDFLQDLLLFHSAKEQALISLDAYVAAMPEAQPYIYYAAGESTQKIAIRPELELVQEHNYDIFYLTDEVDEFVMQLLSEYSGKKLKSVYDDDLGLTDTENTDEQKKLEETHQALLDFAIEALDGKVSAVKLSRKLKKNPVSLGIEGDLSLEMEKYFAQMAKLDGADAPKAQRVLQLNPHHAIFTRLTQMMATDQAKAKQYVTLLYHQALLLADLPLDNLSEYIDLTWDLLS